MTAYLHLSDMSGKAFSEPPLVWVPGEKVACHELSVPPLNKKKWQAMIPWLLEEKILQTAESLLINSGVKGKDNQVPVLAVDKEVFRQWQNDLEERGIAYQAMVPDFFALPWQEGEISLAFVGERCLLRSGRWQGMAGDSNFVLALLAGLESESNKKITVYYQGEKPVLNPPELGEASYQSVGDLFCPSSPDYLALAAGEIKTPVGKSWSLPAIAASVLLVLGVLMWGGSRVLESRQMEVQVEHFENQLRRGYRQYFGESYDFAMEDFQRVVSSQLHASDEGSGGTDTLALFSKVGTWMNNCRACQIDRLEVNRDGLTLNLSGENIESSLRALAENNPQVNLRKRGDGWKLSYLSEEDNG